MNALSAISSWSAREEPIPFGRLGGLRCGCAELSVDQRRLQVLEAGAELHRLRDRVRKAVSRYSTGTPGERPVKRSRTQRAVESKPVIEVQWNVTAEQLVEHLCFWRHSSALACIETTDSLKELTPRCQEPPASRRGLTLVWWDMDETLERAADWNRCNADEAEASEEAARMAAWKERVEAAGRSPTVVQVTVGDLVPLFVWEVDLLRTRPQTRSLCANLLHYQRMVFQSKCGTADEYTETYLREHRIPRFDYNRMMQIQSESVAVAAAATAGDVPIKQSVTMSATVTAQPAAAVARVIALPPRRRPLGESLVTEVGMNDDWQYSTLSDSSMAE